MRKNACIGSMFIGALLMAGTAFAAPQRVLVLPFAVNSPTSAQQLANDMPVLVRQGLARHGIKAVPTSSSAKSSVGTDAARRMARSAKAQYAVFGSLNRIGNGFGLDMQVVDAESGKSRTYHREGSELIELAAAVNTLTEQATADMGGGTSADPQKKAPVKGGIADIQVKGAKILDADRILMRVATKKGDPVSEEAIDADVRNIWDLGYFSDVSADVTHGAGGPVLVYKVVEKPRIESVRVEGSDAVRLTDINEAMTTHTGSVLNEKVLAEDLQKVTDLYHKKGFYLADVTYEVQPRSDGTAAALVLNVKEGSKLYIKEVSVEGLQEISEGDIKKFLSLKERGMFSWFTGTGVLKDEFLERDAQNIKAYFLKNGYVDGQVAAPEVRYEEDGIRVIFRVKEGMHYKVGNVSLKGDLIDTQERILSEISMDERHEKGEFFDVEELQNDVKALTNFYNDYGYAFVDVNVNPQPRPEEGVVDVVYTIKPGERQYIRRVEVEGNTRTRDNVILREMRLADGQQFNGAKMRRSAQRLEKTRYFSEVNPKVVPTGTPGEVDLKMGVKETETGVVSVGFGYSTYDKFGVMATITENNLFGRGYTLGLTGYTSSSQSYMEASFVNPRLFDTYWGFSFNPFVIKEEWSYFYRTSAGASMRVFHPIGEYTNVSFGYKLDRYNLYHMSDNASRIIRAYKGKHWASVVSMGISRDTTNKATFPTEGTKISLNLQYAGPMTGGDDRFFKPVFEAGFYYGLNDTNILHARGTLGAVYQTEHNKVVPVFERFWIGGIRSIRGYSYDDISPRDKKTHETIGSDRMGYANFEYIWVVKPEIGLAFVPFYDIGFNCDHEQVSHLTEKLYSSAGLEVRWRSPMGDLRFAYGFPLSRNADGERRRSGRFEFTMGQAF